MSKNINGKGDLDLNGSSRYTSGSEHSILNEKASEDQVRCSLC